MAAARVFKGEVVEEGVRRRVKEQSVEVGPKIVARILALEYGSVPLAPQQAPKGCKADFLDRAGLGLRLWCALGCFLEFLYQGQTKQGLGCFIVGSWQ